MVPFDIRWSRADYQVIFVSTGQGPLEGVIVDFNGVRYDPSAPRVPDIRHPDWPV